MCELQIDGKYDVIAESDDSGVPGLLLVQGNNTSDIVDIIRFAYNPDSSASNDLQLDIRSDTIGRTSIGTIEKILVDANVGLRVVRLRITGDLGELGVSDEIVVTRIEDISVGGDIYADIIADPGGFTGPNVLLDGDWVEGSLIIGGSAGLRDIMINGSVGSSAESVDFWGDTIDLIDIGGDFWGRIGENDEGFTGHPDVELIDIGGDFNGSASMTLNSLDSMVIGGDFDAEMTVSSVLASTAIYDIAGEFASTAELTLPADGLEGQIIINTGNNSDPWDGEIVVGTTTLTNNYTTLSAELGGGAVGRVPYNFHQRESAAPTGIDPDCSPYMNQHVVVAYVSPDPFDSVTIAHYGPVKVNNADGTYPLALDFRVEFKPDYNPTSWVGRSEDFEVDFTQTGYDDASATRNVVIKATSSNKTGFKAAGRWRIRHLAGKVKCANVPGSPNVVYDSSVVSGDLGSSAGIQYSWYQFRVSLAAPSGMMIMGDENGPQSEDLAAWLDEPYETNADGETNAQDFADLVNNY